VMEAKSLPAIN
ncbi:hypothetical protein VCHC50A2_3213B, partial [Vibrio cholerae HC-50A2]